MPDSSPRAALIETMIAELQRQQHARGIRLDLSGAQAVIDGAIDLGDVADAILRLGGVGEDGHAGGLIAGMPSEEWEIQMVASHVITQHGAAGATEYAAERIAALHQAGDEEGAFAWSAISRRIEALGRRSRDVDLPAVG